MGLFNKKNDELLERVKADYSRIMSGDYSKEEVLDAVDSFHALCNSISENDKKAYRKILIKESKRDKSINSYDHPVLGFFFEGDDVFRVIVQHTNSKKQLAWRAIQREKEFNSIEDITPTINKQFILESNPLKDIPQIKIQNITKSFDIETSMPTFVVIDLETTGLKPNKDAIVQLSAIRYEYQEPTEAFVTLINPGCHIPSDASNVNNIYDEDVKDAPLLSEVAEDFLSFVGNSPILGFNVPFDLQFLFCAGVDLIKKRKIYDAKVLAKKLYKNDIEYYSLENVLDYNCITIGGLHDAKIDCYATALVFLEMVKEITATY